MENMVASKNILNHFSGKKVLITGHTGFKGSWLTQILKLAGAEIIGIALEPKYDQDLFNLLGTTDTISQHHIQDIRDLEKTKKIIVEAAPDIIFHLAAQPLVIPSYEDPVYTYEVNLMGTIHVLEALRDLQKPCTVVMITTDKVYENKEVMYPYKESDPLGGHDPYSASKATCEIAISSYKRSFFSKSENKNIASARAGNVIGGGDLSEKRLIPDLYKAAINNEAIQLRFPDAVRPWQHVIEPLWAYIYMAYLMDSEGYAIDQLNIGPLESDTLSVREVVQLFLQEIEEKPEVKMNTPPTYHEAKLLMLDIQKAKEAINWTPLLNAKEAIQWTAHWYFSDQEASTKTNFQIKKYLNIWDNKYRD